MNLKKGDEVEVIYGKDVGKSGEILKIEPEEERVIVEGINIVHRHTQPTQDMPQGGIIENEAPIHISNVQLICPNCGQRSRTGITILDNGEKARVCKKCDEVVDR